MYDPVNVALLATESQRVIELRLWKLARGGSAGIVEAYHMVTQGAHATVRLVSGASFDSVVSDYRSVVQANVQRLSGLVSSATSEEPHGI